MTDEHAPLGPSAAEGWSTCAAYVNANKGLPDDSSYVAVEGTFAHLISDICLLTGHDARDFVGVTVKLKDWTFGWEEDDADMLQRGIDYIRAIPGQFFGEQRVDISPFTLPGQFGTLDRAVWDGETLTICDLKFGRGIPVSPVENKQLMLYALGLWHRLGRPEVKRFVLIIDQPRHAGGGGIWETTQPELLQFADWIKARAALTLDPDAPRTASLLGCLWCRRRKVKYGCDTFDEYMLELLGQTTDELDYDLLYGGKLMLPEILTPERRSHILNHASLIENWLENLAARELEDAMTGEPTPARKMVLGRKSPAAWTDKTAAAVAAKEILGDDAFKTELKTPLQVLKLLKEDGDAQKPLRALIDYGERRPTMVDASDARQAVEPADAGLEDL